ncbi:flagellar biosynthesis protein FlhF [Paenibacillus sp. OV219]|uniref:flagellar biosynthesis protein FlhF n=1 Tax=Paenibacillus sp. OV219 TaxID=1884377 RepID=UPI0008AD56AB|nr:flagellar biosynthesis protein FlhF [Paenibacillus sp. OV219]SEN32629.1 flagellar biosynthesis protein FlhF [Paenibacillus sp. OV219]
MKVKRYVVNALPEALPMIRSELGIDAVILNTKEIRVGGFLGMFGKKKTEVIAAVETGSANNSSSSSKAKPPARTQTAVGARPNAMPQASPKPVVPAAPSPAAASVFDAVLSHAAEVKQARAAATATEVHELPKISPAAAYGARTAAPSEVPVAVAPEVLAQDVRKPLLTEDHLLAEIRDMKQWIVRMSKQQQQEARPAAIQALQDKLEDQEVDQQWIDQLIEQVEAEMNEAKQHGIAIAADDDTAYVWGCARRILIGWMRKFEANQISRDTQVIHFVGPTGVGKTTSIAKLAAEQTLKAGRKVGFITSDTYRIAAVDQLRTYATILNVPLEVVFSPAEVTRAFKQLEGRELIFMDTAGRNFRNELYVSEVNSLLQSGSHSMTYLVLSLTGKFSDMSTVAGNFAKYGIDHVLFTKQDETHACGAILNLALEHGLKPTYVACGQTVPDDIAPFQAASYVEQLLGASDDK